MLELQNLRGGYAGKAVLNDISARMEGEKITVLLGPNGCGKSTLLKMICGILPPQSGQIRYRGQSLADCTQKQRAQTVAYLAQSRPIPEITVRQLVLHGRFPHLSYPRKYRKIDYEITENAMEKMKISHLADTPMQALSGGQRQKVYIAMALAQDTPIILLDEPTTYLDVQHQLQIMDEACLLRAAGKTVVMVLHDLNQALQIADEILLMQQGQLVMQGTPEEIYNAGKLDEVFGVSVRRQLTEQGWQYYWGRNPVFEEVAL